MLRVRVHRPAKAGGARLAQGWCKAAVVGAAHQPHPPCTHDDGDGEFFCLDRLDELLGKGGFVVLSHEELDAFFAV